MASGEDWVPTSWGGKREQINAIKGHIGEFGTQLDLDALAISAIEQRCTGALAVIDYFDQSKGVQNGVSDWRDSTLLSGPEGQPMGGPPVNDAFAVPAGSITGFYKWLRSQRAKWVEEDGYTTAIGETLQIATPTGEGADPSTIKPELECQTAMSGNFDFSAVIGNRGDSDACDLTACVVGTTNYQLLTTFTGKGTTGHWPDGTTAPIQIQVRAQLKRKNANYGIPSDPFIVTVIP